MGIFSIGSEISSKDFTLNVLKDGYYVSICAYGDFWGEFFKTKENLENYLKVEWNFTNKQIKELYTLAEHE